MHSECHGLEVASRIAEVALFVGPLLVSAETPSLSVRGPQTRPASPEGQGLAAEECKRALSLKVLALPPNLL